MPDSRQDIEEQQDVVEQPKKQPKKHLIRPTWLRRTLKTLMWLVIVVLLLPVLIYVPPVQRLLVNVACKVVKNSTGMDASIGEFRLKFPLDVSLRDVVVLEASKDTMVRAGEVVADVKLLPLLKLDVQLNKLQLNDGYYRMVSKDSSMILSVNAGFLEVDDKSSANIGKSRILLNKVKLRDGALGLYMNVWKKKEEPDTAKSESTPFYIQANDLQLENFRFGMSMLPTIDTLDLKVKSVRLKHGVVDLKANLVKWKVAAIDSGRFQYYTPTPEYVRTHPAPPSKPSTGPPMRIMGDSISLTGLTALYATRGVKPAPGFDAGYISVSDVAIALRDFYNESSTVRLPIARLQARERCGLRIASGSGTVGIDSLGLTLDNLNITTGYSAIKATADVPFALMALKPQAPVNATLSGHIGIPDVEAFMPSLKQFTSLVPARKPLNLDLKAKGTLSALNVGNLLVAMPGVVKLQAKGAARNPLDVNRLSARLAFDGELADPRLADKFLSSSGIEVPAFTIKGNAEVNGREYGADFDLRTTAGDVVGRGRVALNPETYTADIRAEGLDVGRFMPSLGIGKVSAAVKASGAGFNPMSGHARTDAVVDISSIEYNRRLLRDIHADVKLGGDGNFSLLASSPNPDIDFDIEGSGRILPDDYTFEVTAHLRDVNLRALGLTDSVCDGSGYIVARGTASPARWLYNVDLDISSLDWNLPSAYIHLPGGVNASLRADSFSTDLTVNSLMTSLDFTSRSGMEQLIKSFTAASDLVMKQLDRRSISADSISALLPQFDLRFNASGRGLLSQFLTPQGMSVDTVYGQFSRDSLLGGDIRAYNFKNPGVSLDTLTLNIKERGQLFDYRAHVGNRPGTMDEFATVNINGYVGNNRLSAFLNQHNIKGETGYRLGFTAAVADSTATVHFTPLRATIAYLPWTFNNDNFVDVNIFNYMIQAKLQASSAESSILVQTEPSAKEAGDDLRVKIDNLHIEDFLKMWAMAPQMSGSLNADMRVHYADARFKGEGTVGLKNFVYEKSRIGDFDLDLDAAYGFNGGTDVKAALRINDDPAMAFHASLSPDSVGALRPDTMGLSLTRFPLKVANPFIGQTAALSGYLNGEMRMEGSFAKPVLNGYVAFDSVTANIKMMNADLRFIDDRVAVVDNVIDFKDFNIYGANNNPLSINGSVNAKDFSRILFDMDMNASNMQLIKSNSRSKADIYGKIFLNLGATVKGPMNLLDINGNLTLLGTTDATYRLNMEPTQFTAKENDGVVKFVSFNDTTHVAQADSVAESALSMRINAGLTIQPGTHLEVILSSNGTDKLEIDPRANLTYTQNFLGDMSLNGTLTTGNGYVRYSVPVIGEKMFTFDPQSTITWNGNVMNPTLNITAVDEMKANVTSDNNSRMVNFLVTLYATSTLQNLKVAFDLSTNDDLTIQNELQSMTADQRQTQAMNMLLYGSYSSQNTKTASGSATNMLYGFLESQINSWAAKHVRGVDLTFGVDEYQKTTNGVTNTETSYSYQVSKSLFNNRFKIKVGGNYSTDDTSDESLANSLVSDVTLEYILKQSATTNMSVQLFRHTGYESVLEGEITEMGAGFVLKRRIESLRDLFNFLRRRKKKAEAADSVSADSAAVSQKSEVMVTK